MINKKGLFNYGILKKNQYILIQDDKNLIVFFNITTNT